jgi:hypothetical protein
MKYEIKRVGGNNCYLKNIKEKVWTLRKSLDVSSIKHLFSSEPSGNKEKQARKHGICDGK